MKCVVVLLVLLIGATLKTDAVPPTVPEINANCQKASAPGNCYMGPYCFGWEGENKDKMDKCDNDVNKMNCKFGFGTFTRAADGKNIKVQLAGPANPPGSAFIALAFKQGDAVKLESVADANLIIACVGVPKAFVGIGKLDQGGKIFMPGATPIPGGDTKLDGDWFVCEFTIPSEQANGINLSKNVGGSYHVGLVGGKSTPKDKNYELTGTQVYSSSDSINIFNDLGNKMDDGNGPGGPPATDASNKLTVGLTLVLLGLVL